MNRKGFLRSFVPLTAGTILAQKAFSMPESIPPAAQIIFPPYLKPGDTVGITCPADPVTESDIAQCKTVLNNWGLHVKWSPCMGKRWQRFGGTDEERAAGLQSLLDDNTVTAIMFGRGGYGVMRMMDKISWEAFSGHPKWLIGFSDITAFHCHIHSIYNIPTIHADMGTGFGGIEDESSESLKNILFGRIQKYKTNPFKLNRPGMTTGKLVGGNLSLITAMQGSKSALKTEGKILLIEDVSEYKYTIDRMMMNLKRSGILSNLAGLIFGGFTATRTNNEDYYPMSMEELLYEKVKEYNYPVCFHFPAGHQKLNLALKLGTYYNFNVSNESVTLEETSSIPAEMREQLINNAIPPFPDTSSIAADSINFRK